MEQEIRLFLRVKSDLNLDTQKLKQTHIKPFYILLTCTKIAAKEHQQSKCIQSLAVLFLDKRI